MNREVTLAGGIAALLAVSLLVTAVVPGVIARPETDDVRAGHLRIEEVTITPGTVAGNTATLAVDTRLAHRGGQSNNVSVLFRAVDLESGLVETTRRISVGEVRGDTEVAVDGNLSVARRGGYRIETILYRDGERIDEGGKEVRGLSALQPEYTQSAVEFHRFDGYRLGADLPVIEYTVNDVENNRTTLDVSAYLTNTGDVAAGDLRLVFKVRQADSYIVADEATVDVGQVRQGRTVSPSASLTVPDGYNYYLDAVLWKDGVIVGTERSVANLNPTETLSANETKREIGLQVSEFESDDRDERSKPTAAADEASSGGTPGFGIGVAVAALAGAALLKRRQSA